MALRKLERLSEAKACFQRVIDADGSFVASFRGLIDCSMTTQDFDEALSFCNNALSILEDDTSLLTDKANVLLKLGRAADALPAYEKVVMRSPASDQVKQLYAIALSQVAVAADKADEFDRAETLYTKAIDIEATATRLFNRAFLFMRTSRLDAALEGFSSVIEADPDNVKAHAALGTLLLQKQSYSEAVDHLRIASKGSSDEQFADVTYNLGFALLKLERFQAAKQAFESVLNVDDSNENAKNGLKAAEARVLQDGFAQPSPADPSPSKAEAPSAPTAFADLSATAGPPEAAAAAAAADVETSGGLPVFPLTALLAKPFPEAVDSAKREEYLSQEDFQHIFGMDKATFEKLPKWKRVSLKKKFGLF